MKDVVAFSRTMWAVSAVIALAAMLVLPSAARADVLFYRIPGSNLVIPLQGNANALPGGNVSFRHPKFGTLYFKLEDVNIRKVPTVQAQFAKQLRKAVLTKDPQQIMEAARWALRHGLLKEFYEAVEEVRKIDPQNERVQQVTELKKMIDTPLPDDPELEQKLRDLVGRPSMRIQRSNHYVMLHDTPDKPREGHKLPRAEERLQLLEQVYEAFMLRFYSQGIELEFPKQRMMVVLFNDYQDYQQFATSLSPDLASASGFWSSDTNVAFFYDHSTDEVFKVLQGLSKELQQAKDEAKRIRAANAAEIVHLANTIELLIEIDQENHDVEVVSHEATHQLAGNTGLLPRHVRVPTWVHEGLATYFESPKDAAWSGIGAVNEQRIEWYRQLERDREHSNIDFIVGDQIFDYAATHGSVLHGYGQAWALTHFLMERHFEKLMTYYRRLGELPPHVTFSQEVLTSVFDEVFGSERRGLDSEWRTYMRSLKTDMELILDEA